MWEQNCVWLFNYFNFERSYDVSKSKSPCFLVNKNINFSKSEMESKMQYPTHSASKTSLVCFSAYKNRKLKVTPGWVGARERKKGNFCTVYIVRWYFLTFVLSQCIVYWNTLSEYTYIYISKTLLDPLL